MPKVDYTATIEVRRDIVWDFVKDMNCYIAASGAKVG